MLITQAVVSWFGSCHRNVGAVISGGKTDPFRGLVDCDSRGIRTRGRGVCSGASFSRCTAHERDGGDDGDPGEQDSSEIETLLIPNRGHSSHLYGYL